MAAKRQRVVDENAPGVVFALDPEEEVVDGMVGDRVHVVVGATLFFCANGRVLPEIASGRSGCGVGAKSSTWGLVHEFTSPVSCGDLGFFVDVDVHTMHTAARLPRDFDGPLLKTLAQAWLKDNRFAAGLLEWSAGVQTRIDPSSGFANVGLRATCHAFVLPDFGARVSAAKVRAAADLDAENALEELLDQKPFALSWTNVVDHPDVVAAGVRVTKVRVTLKCRGSHSTDSDHHVRRDSVELDLGTLQVKTIEWRAEDPVLAWARAQGVTTLEDLVRAAFISGETVAYYNMLEYDEAPAALDPDTYKAGDSVGSGSAKGTTDVWVLVPEDIVWRLASYPLASYDQEAVRTARVVVEEVAEEEFSFSREDCFRDPWFREKGGVGMEALQVEVCVKRTSMHAVKWIEVSLGAEAKRVAARRGWDFQEIVSGRGGEVTSTFQAGAWEDNKATGPVWVYFAKE